jgi:hypothetical protein
MAVFGQGCGQKCLLPQGGKRGLNTGCLVLLSVSSSVLQFQNILSGIWFGNGRQCLSRNGRRCLSRPKTRNGASHTCCQACLQLLQFRCFASHNRSGKLPSVGRSPSGVGTSPHNIPLSMERLNQELKRSGGSGQCTMPPPAEKRGAILVAIRARDLKWLVHAH